MERIILTVLLLCFRGGFAQDDFADTNLTLLNDLDNGRIYVEEGGDLDLTCRVKTGPNKALDFVLKYSVTWNHELYWNNSTSTTPMTLNANKQGVYSTLPNYKIEYDLQDNYIDLNLVIKPVRREDDGKMICSSTVGSNILSTSVEIVVIKPIKTIGLKFAHYSLLTDSPVEPLEVDVGKTVRFTCSVEGSNPGVNDLRVLLDSVELTNLSKPNPIPMPTDFRQYQTIVGGEIKILTDHHYKYLKCEAPFPNGTAESIQIQLKVNTYDPLISCKDGEGYEGKMYVQVECDVNITGIDMQKIYFRLADVGENLYEGSNDYNGDNFKVEEINMNQDLYNVKMTILKAKEWHFREKLLLVVESAGNHVTEERLKINKIPGKTDPKKPGDNNGSAKGTISLATVFLTCIVTVYALVL